MNIEKNTRIPLLIIILFLVNLITGIILIGVGIVGFLGFSTLSIIISIAALLIGIINLYLAKGLIKSEKWAYFALILLSIINIVSLILYITLTTIIQYNENYPELLILIISDILILLYLLKSKRTKVFFRFSQDTKPKEILKKSWAFLKEDTWQSWLVSLLLVVIIIRFILFPLLSLITGSPLPLVIIESCSMYHDLSFDKWWSLKAGSYNEFNITKEDFSSYLFKNGLNKGDIIFVWAKSSYRKGDIIIFQPNKEAKHSNPIIHRIVAKQDNIIGTRGDNNEFQLKSNDNRNPSNIDETAISQNRISGKAVTRIPYLGWIKLIFFEHLRPPEQKGFC